MQPMDAPLTAIDLHPGRPLTLPPADDHWLLVLQGRIWLTRSDDPDDHFLEAGQRLLLAEQDIVVVEADGGRLARVCLQAIWQPADRADDAAVRAA